MSGNHTCDLLVTADMAVVHEGKLQDDAAIVINDGFIIDVADRQKALAAYSPTTTLSLGNSLLLPGLVNAHTHLPMTLLKGIADDMPLMQWLNDHIWPVESRLTPELLELGATIGCAEMIRTGTTAFINGYFLEKHTGTAVDKAGIRAVLGEGFFGFPSPMFPTAEHCWEATRRLAKRYATHPRIRTAVTPHAVFTVKPDELVESYALAEELDIPWQIHLAESPEETADCMKKTGKRPLELLSDLGILSPRCTLHHCVDLNEREIAILAESGANVSHNPASNLKLASGIAPIQAMLDAGISVGIGTDGSASNNQLNMFREMGLAALCGKVRNRNASAVSAKDVLRMATTGSAKCIHWPELGTLAPGAPADMCALDLASPNLMPLNSPVSHAVYAATGQEVRMTMCAGKILYQDGRFLSIDMESLKMEADKARQWISALGK